MSAILQTLIDEDFGYRHEGRHWGRAQKHTSLVVDERQQKWYWNSANQGGDAVQYLVQIRGMARKSAEEMIRNLSRIIKGASENNEELDYSPYEKLVDTLWEFGKNNRDYWYSRKLTDATIDRNRLGFYNGWSCIPLYYDGRFVNFQCRRDEPSKAIKYWYDGSQTTPILMNAEILQLSSTVYMTEGTVDSILLRQEGLASVAHSGGAGYWNQAWYPLFSKVDTIYYIADNDSAGWFAAKRIAKALGETKVKIYSFSTNKEKYDTVDFFRDGGSIDELKELIHKNSKYCFEIGDDNGSFKFAARGRSKGGFAKTFAKSY